ncbi:DUF1659 domain-containing protein [Massilibacterium senegalense]|uniref:DUF1659 domain-containing protein n=1 Tax=Massilibacterium senegalense TaxID=1632858 RepID=UPI00078665B8|nr:DUF1659 domain-containing protein [Massilibacterium senegalense]
MAVESKMNTQLRLVLQKGVNAKGEMMLASKVITGLHLDATAEQCNRIGRLIASLQKFPLERIERVETNLIQE